MNWSCTKCGKEFNGGNVACCYCPECGEHLTANCDPFGYWDGDIFYPICIHNKPTKSPYNIKRVILG